MLTRNAGDETILSLIQNSSRLIEGPENENLHGKHAAWVKITQMPINTEFLDSDEDAEPSVHTETRITSFRVPQLPRNSTQSR